MDASGFTMLAGHFPGPHGPDLRPARVGRHPPWADGVTGATPDEHAEDLQRLISELAVGGHRAPHRVRQVRRGCECRISAVRSGRGAAW